MLEDAREGLMGKEKVVHSITRSVDKRMTVEGESDRPEISAISYHAYLRTEQLVVSTKTCRPILYDSRRGAKE